MRLLMAFVALGVAMAYLHERKLWQRLVLVISTAPIAVLCNIVRVTATGFIYILIHPKYAQGVYHDMLGMAMLPLAFGLYGLLALFMSNLFMDDEADVEDIVVRKRDR
jgi:exosortase/archaeosortase family protein